MTDAPKLKIPFEAAQIMGRLVRLPPKPHGEMKIGRSKEMVSPPSAGPKKRGLPLVEREPSKPGSRRGSNEKA